MFSSSCTILVVLLRQAYSLYPSHHMRPKQGKECFASFLNNKIQNSKISQIDIWQFWQLELRTIQSSTIIYALLAWFYIGRCQLEMREINLRFFKFCTSTFDDPHFNNCFYINYLELTPRHIKKSTFDFLAWYLSTIRLLSNFFLIKLKISTHLSLFSEKKFLTVKKLYWYKFKKHNFIEISLFYFFWNTQCSLKILYSFIHKKNYFDLKIL